MIDADDNQWNAKQLPLMIKSYLKLTIKYISAQNFYIRRGTEHVHLKIRPFLGFR